MPTRTPQTGEPWECPKCHRKNVNKAAKSNFYTRCPNCGYRPYLAEKQ